jgi:hypothetical protein
MMTGYKRPAQRAQTVIDRVLDARRGTAGPAA